jgi:hypothetical protein
MYGILLGVTPPGAPRKMNQDNNVCSTLTSNLMNEGMNKYDYVWYEMIMIMYEWTYVWLWNDQEHEMMLDMYKLWNRACYECYTDDDLRFP